MIVSINATEKLAISAFGTYANAIEPTLANLYQNSYFWIGQFSADDVNYDINQVYFAFSGVGEAGKRIKSAKLLVSPIEVYGFNEVIVFHHEWTMSGTSFIKASQFSTLNEIGRTVFDQEEGIPSMQAIDLDLPADFTGSLRVALAPADQGRMNPSAADVTLVVNDAILEIEYEEAVSPIIIEAEASFDLVASGLATTVSKTNGSGQIVLSAEAQSRTVSLGNASASFDLEGSASVLSIVRALAETSFELQASGIAQTISTAFGEGIIELDSSAQASPIIRLEAIGSVTFRASGRITDSQPLTADPDRTIIVQNASGTLTVVNANGIGKVANQPHILRVFQ